ncbi:MAG: putative zinc-binding protein [Spirochaetales bacterium]|nr:putative zinc-binding protein [Spirochaetales bacterium]
MGTENKETANWNLLPSCGKEAEGLDIILACDGAASVGQVGHEVAVDLTKRDGGARMCCLSAVAADSKTHVGIAKRARRLIVINGCANRCASKILEQKNIPYTYEATISELDVKKIPTLDFSRKDVDRIAEKIAEEALGEN